MNQLLKVHPIHITEQMQQIFKYVYRQLLLCWRCKIKAIKDSYEMLCLLNGVFYTIADNLTLF